jgi:hypothetical protein
MSYAKYGIYCTEKIIFFNGRDNSAFEAQHCVQSTAFPQENDATAGGN